MRITERCRCGASIEVDEVARDLGLKTVGGVVDLWRAEHACGPASVDPMESETGALLATISRLHELVIEACAGWHRVARFAVRYDEVAGIPPTYVGQDRPQEILDEAERISK